MMKAQRPAPFYLLCIVFLSGFLVAISAGCSRDSAEDLRSLQERLIMAESGETILIGEGTHHFTRQLSLMGIDNVTIKGAGMDKTILSFKDQIEGAEGLFVRANGIIIEDLTIADTKGDGIKIQDSDGVTLRNVKVHWTGGPDESNGAYGLYPVASRNILIEHTEVSGASDAGIYVGQSQDIVVRHNRVFENVAGIEIENSARAEVYENDVQNNTGGILVFDLPELPVKNGRDIRIHNNVVRDNNHRNFAPPGNIVGMVPAGTGLLVMATDNVVIKNNEITGHQSSGLAIVSYFITQLEYTDPEYNPFTSGVAAIDNRISRSPALPDTSRAMGQLLAGLFGTNVPDIIFDGVMNPAYLDDSGATFPERRICIGSNGEASFANINAPSGFSEISTDLSPFRCSDEEISALTASGNSSP
jgi:parallel beta-helix repeat protein